MARLAALQLIENTLGQHTNQISNSKAGSMSSTKLLNSSANVSTAPSATSG